MAQPFQNEISNAYLNSEVAFTSVSTVYNSLRSAARSIDPSAREAVQYPSKNQVKDVLARIDIAQTTTAYKVKPAEYDTILARYRGPGRQGVRRHQVMLDLAIYDRWWRSNRLRPADTIQQSFVYAAVFIDVWSRLVVVYPIQNKNAATLLRVTRQAWNYYQGWENFTVDGESAINTAGTSTIGVKQLAVELNFRLWVNETPSRGKSTVATVERVIRTIKDRLYKRSRVQGSRSWSLPVGGDAYWTANPPPTAMALGLPANATLPQRKRRVISSDPRIPSPIQEVVRQYNTTKHSSLGTSPVDVFLNDTQPLYITNALAAGICTQGTRCTPQAKRGVRRRAIATLFKPGDVVRTLKTIRDFQKRSETKVWSAGLWRVLGEMHPNGLANYDQGPNPNLPVKAGHGRRFLLERIGDNRRMQALHWQMKLTDVDTTGVVVPETGAHNRIEALESGIGSQLTNYQVAPLSLSGSKAEMGRRGQQFTQQAASSTQTARSRRAADIDIDPYASVDETPIQTRDRSSAIASRAGSRRQMPAKPNRLSGGGAKKKKFKVGDRINAYYPTLRANFIGLVKSIESDASLVVEFNPTRDYPQGSEAVIKAPYSFVKKV